MNMSKNFPMLRKIWLAAPMVALLTGCEASLLGSTAVGCAARPEPILLPEQLPDAKVGAPYRQSITIANASTPVHGFYVSDKTPLPDGLHLEHLDREAQALIEGIPTRAGIHEVHISAGTYGTQCVGQRAERTYELRIND
jgi:hypothetical protein